jgi:uncharacterized membrane protein
MLLLRLFIAMAPDGMPFLSKARIDPRILAFALATSVICAVFFGLLPGIRKAGAEALTSRTRTTMRHAVLRRGLVIAQIAVSMVLLAGGALLAHSFWNIEKQSLGMNSENIVTAAISLGQTSYPTPESQMAFFQRLEAICATDQVSPHSQSATLYRQVVITTIRFLLRCAWKADPPCHQGRAARSHRDGPRPNTFEYSRFRSCKGRVLPMKNSHRMIISWF